MHDQRKVRQEIDEATRERNFAEVKEFTALYDSLLKQRDENVYTEAMLRQMSELLCKNPEAYSMYNYRRKALLHIWKELREKRMKRDGEGIEESKGVSPPSSQTEKEKKPKTAVKSEMDWLKEELKLNSKILLRDYKVYAAFLHRRWVFAQLKRIATDAVLSTAKTTDKANSAIDKGSVDESPEEMRVWSYMLMKEKEQCDALLSVDERNFHAWNYRRWALGEIAQMEKLLSQCSVGTAVNSSMNVAKEEKELSVKPLALLFTPDELKELKFTTKMIQKNFSNYSAWHQRGLIIKMALQRLQKSHEDDAMRDAKVNEAWVQLKEDLSLFTTAIYCDPSDQSAWYYAQFLSRAADILEDISPAHHAVCREEFVIGPIKACLELLTEERRLGDDTEVYWPHYYLFTVLLSSCNTGNSNNDRQKRVAAAVNSMTRDIRMALCPNSSLSEASGIGEDRLWCLGELAAELVRADPMRTGMYQSLLAKATSGSVSTC